MSEAASDSAPAKPRRDVVAGFKELQTAEKVLAAAAVASLLAFVLLSEWGQLFEFEGKGWFFTLGFVGALGVVVVTALGLFGLKPLDTSLRTVLLITFGVLPAIGFVLYSLGEFWWSTMLAGAVVMGYAAAKITSREKIL